MLTIVERIYWKLRNAVAWRVKKCFRIIKRSGLSKNLFAVYKRNIQPDIHPIRCIEEKVQRFDKNALQRAYSPSYVASAKDDFALIRIIGNDLYPRHQKGQSRRNLQFILDHEESFSGCRKMWIVNRIFDDDERSKIISLLQDNQQEFIEIPFDFAEYLALAPDHSLLPAPDYMQSDEFAGMSEEDKSKVLNAVYRFKNNYVMNNNGARNLALREGKRVAKWVMPWDGNCFLTLAAWNDLQATVINHPWYSHFVVPMARMLSNEDLLKENINHPEPLEEPQLVFRQDTHTEFNPDFYYGRRPKVELFWTLGIPGKWDYWRDDFFDLPRRSLSDEAHCYNLAGWVARLYSGMEKLETADASANRFFVRQSAVLATLSYLDDISNESSKR